MSGTDPNMATPCVPLAKATTAASFLVGMPGPVNASGTGMFSGSMKIAEIKSTFGQYFTAFRLNVNKMSTKSYVVVMLKLFNIKGLNGS